MTTVRFEQIELDVARALGINFNDAFRLGIHFLGRKVIESRGISPLTIEQTKRFIDLGDGLLFALRMGSSRPPTFIDSPLIVCPSLVPQQPAVSKAIKTMRVFDPEREKKVTIPVNQYIPGYHIPEKRKMRISCPADDL